MNHLSIQPRSIHLTVACNAITHILSHLAPLYILMTGCASTLEMYLDGLTNDAWLRCVERRACNTDEKASVVLASRINNEENAVDVSRRDTCCVEMDWRER